MSSALIGHSIYHPCSSCGKPAWSDSPDSHFGWSGSLSMPSPELLPEPAAICRPSHNFRLRWQQPSTDWPADSRRAAAAGESGAWSVSCLVFPWQLSPGAGRRYIWNQFEMWERRDHLKDRVSRQKTHQQQQNLTTFQSFWLFLTVAQPCVTASPEIHPGSSSHSKGGNLLGNGTNSSSPPTSFQNLMVGIGWKW